MKKLTLFTLLFAFSLLTGFDAWSCAVVEISGPSTIYLDTPADEGGAKEFKILNTEDHVWDGYHHTSWEFVLGNKVGQKVTYSTVGKNVSPGTYTLTATAHFYDGDGNEYNTQTATKQVKLLDGPKPDLVVSADGLVENPPSELVAGSSYSSDFKVYNQGNKSVNGGDTEVKVYWSRNNQVDSGDELEDTITLNESIGAGSESYEHGFQITAPNELGNFYLLLAVDPDEQVDESEEDNNVQSFLITITNNQGIIAPKVTKDNLVQIKNISGKIYWEEGQEQLDFSRLQKGHYLFIYNKEGKEEIKQVIKQ